MNLYLIIPVFVSVFIVVIIPYCFFRTFKFERMMQLRIINSTIIDIFNMSSDDRRIGLNANTTLRKQNKFKILFAGNDTIKFFKTNHNEQEWHKICARNIQQATNLGFLKKIANVYDFDLFTDHRTDLVYYEKKFTFNYSNNDYVIIIRCSNDEIILINPHGRNNKI